MDQVLLLIENLHLLLFAMAAKFSAHDPMMFEETKQLKDSKD
jgi:hypothetical protein